MAEFDAILFDAGGVLLLPDPVVTQPVLEPFGGPAEADAEPVLVRAHFAGVHAMDHARADGDLAEWPAYFRSYAEAAGVPDSARLDAVDALTGMWDHHAWVRPVDGAQQVLAALAERVPIGVVSNAGGQVEDDLSRLGIIALEPLADAATAQAVCIVDSHLVGVAKPDPAIFETALTALGRAASRRIAYVGDTVFYDVRASVAAGLTPLLHDPYGFHQADPHPAASRTISGLQQLLDLV